MPNAERSIADEVEAAIKVGSSEKSLETVKRVTELFLLSAGSFLGYGRHLTDVQAAACSPKAGTLSHGGSSRRPKSREDCGRNRHCRPAAGKASRRARGRTPTASWPGLTRPSTPSCRAAKNVDARHKAGHDGCIGSPRQSHGHG